MSTRIRTSLKTAIAATLIALLAPASLAQSLYEEKFEDLGFVPIGQWGPSGLINKGWIFTNNSSPVGPVGWFAGCCWNGVIDPLSGTGYLAASADSATGGQYSLWAVLPEVAGQQTGDILTIHTISSDTSPFESVHLEVRYSPSGGTDVGTAATDVGDFTQVLQTISPMPNYNQGLADGWTKWEMTLPGPGRIALRQMGDESMYFGIEDTSVVHPTPPPGGPLPEDFDDLGGICGEGACALVDAGWIFKDQGTLSIGPAWQPPYANDPFTPQEGFSFLKCSKGAGSGSINTWAILPPIPDQQAGDELSFSLRGDLQDDGVFEVRYSPSGGTFTGTGGFDVGDFTEVLFEATTLSFDAWEPVAATLPGSGRIALRVADPFQVFFDPATIAAIDTMVLNKAVPGDIDGDGDVDGADLGALLGAWGEPGGPADLDGNGVVDGSDLGLLLGAWTA